VTRSDAPLPDGSPGARIDRRFAAEVEAHRRDAPRFCPACARDLGLATEFWEGDQRRFYCWCASCDWTGEVTTTGETALGHEPQH